MPCRLDAIHRRNAIAGFMPNSFPVRPSPRRMARMNVLGCIVFAQRSSIPAAIARWIPELKPVKLTGTMAFMFETRFPQRVTAHAAKLPSLQKNYIGCWDGLPKRFNPQKNQAW